MSEEVIITLLEIAVVVLVIWLIAARLAWQELKAEARSETRWADHYHRENVALRAQIERQEARWQSTLDAVIEDWGEECDGLITEIGDLKEQIAAQAYVIGALKVQVRDSQQAGMTLQIAAQEPPYQEYERLTSENAKLRKLLDWALRPEAHAALMAEYARAGKVTEGCESNIPY
jgi:hypothetical protein